MCVQLFFYSKPIADTWKLLVIAYGFLLLAQRAMLLGSVRRRIITNLIGDLDFNLLQVTPTDLGQTYRPDLRSYLFALDLTGPEPRSYDGAHGLTGPELRSYDGAHDLTGPEFRSYDSAHDLTGPELRSYDGAHDLT